MYLGFQAELVTACCLPSMADGKSADEPNVDQWWTSTKMWPPGTCTNGPLFHLDVLQHQLGLQHLVLQLLLLLLLLLLHLLCYTAGPSSFLKLPLLFSLHISAPQFSLKPLLPLMPSASSLTQVWFANRYYYYWGERRSNGRRRVGGVAVEWPAFLSGGKCWKCARGGLLGTGSGEHPGSLQLFIEGLKWSLSMKFEHHRDMSGCRSVDCVKT